FQAQARPPRRRLGEAKWLSYPIAPAGTARAPTMARKTARSRFDPQVFLATVDGGRTMSAYERDEAIFSQGDPADAVFYVQGGTIKIAVTSEQGKEAVVGMLKAGDFLGEGCLIGQPLRLATASAMTQSRVMRIAK